MVARRLDTPPSKHYGETNLPRPVIPEEAIRYLTGAVQRTSFQYSFFNMYAMPVNMSRNNTTQMPSP